MVRLKKQFLGCALLLGASIGLQATPMPPSCSEAANFAVLQADGSCVLGDKLYSNFFYASTAVNDTSVPSSQVNIVSTSSTTAANGFLFSLPLGATIGQTQDISLGYTVTDLSRTSLIDSVDVPIFVGGATGTGLAELDESIYGPSGLLGTLNITPTSSNSPLKFAGVTRVTIFKDLIVKGGTAGSGTISIFSDYVDQTGVPEPGFYGVLAGGLGAVLMFARRRKKTA